MPEALNGYDFTGFAINFAVLAAQQRWFCNIRHITKGKRENRLEIREFFPLLDISR